MSAIKNGQISLYCHFNKIMKGPGTSFQYPTLMQKHVRIFCHTTHQYLRNFPFDRTIMTMISDFAIFEYHKNSKIYLVFFSSNDKTH